MTNIIQDFKDWLSARRETSRIEKNLQQYKKSITEQCDAKNFSKNLYKWDVFHASLTYAAASDDFEKYHRIEKERGVTCRASSCFYKLSDSFGKVPFAYRGTKINPKEVFSCINVRGDGKLFVQRCDGCPHYKELVAYQTLWKNERVAEEIQEIAKQKLLDNFRFWEKNKER